MAGGIDSELRGLVFPALELQPASNAAARNKSLNAPRKAPPDTRA
jgi:hypothetical protein